MTTVTMENAPQLLAEAQKARRAGDTANLVRLADALLAFAPREPRVLVIKADALGATGDHRSAASFYSAALAHAQGMASIPADLKAEFDHAVRMQANMARRFEQELRQGLTGRGFDSADPALERFSASLELMSGRRQVYYQQPKFYLLPGLPQIEFQPRDTVSWLSDVEAVAGDIRKELDGILAEPELFAPYVEDRSNRPRNEQGGMVGNADWSAVFLWKDGQEVPEVAERCPLTIQVLSKAPLCRIPGRSPSILFSKLAAGAVIPPHHGLINTRLICHLPLVAPSGSKFRVGNTVREWHEGQAWAFDDTIEHEARNDSGNDRTILIFDVWKPEITSREQDMIRALFATIDASGTQAPKLGV